MADANVVDYYSVLNLPPTADLAGIENAYARISDELAMLTTFDEGHRDALKRVNEAYSVLSHPKLRRDYDTFFLAEDRAAREREFRRRESRRTWMQRSIIGVLLLVVLVQIGTVAYLAREEVTSAAHVVLGPLAPNQAN
ncbi:MAG: DnaJ domain-containing protein [Chloroflexi bacterium]|nr:DnaJ domain-containing protein [Chloroflexota bacterium]